MGRGGSALGAGLAWSDSYSHYSVLQITPDMPCPAEAQPGNSQIRAAAQAAVVRQCKTA